MSGAVTLKQVYKELKQIEKKMLTKKDIEVLIDTVEIMSNPETIEQINKSKRDIAHGRVKEISSAKDLLREI